MHRHIRARTYEVDLMSAADAVQERAQRHEELEFGFFFYCGTTILGSDTDGDYGRVR